MAATKKKRVEDDDENELSISEEENEEEMEADAVNDSNEDDASEDDALNQIVSIEFEARVPEDSDFDGIRQLLKQLFLKSHVNLSELTNLILQQNYIGSVIKQGDIPEECSDEDEDDDIVFGVVSIINLTEKKENPCVQQIWALLQDWCKRSGSKQSANILKNLFENAESSHQVGLILNERMVNIPSDIAAPLFENLGKEIKSACNKKMKFNFSHYIIINKLYKCEVKGGKITNAGKALEAFSNPEEESFSEEAIETFEVCVHGESDTAIDGEWEEDGEGMKPYRRVLIIPGSKWDAIVAKTKNFSQSA